MGKIKEHYHDRIEASMRGFDKKETLESILADNLFSQPFMIEMFGEEPEYEFDYDTARDTDMDRNPIMKEHILIEINAIKKVDDSDNFGNELKNWAKQYELDNYFDAIYIDDDGKGITIVFDVPHQDDFWAPEKYLNQEEAKNGKKIPADISVGDFVRVNDSKDPLNGYEGKVENFWGTGKGKHAVVSLTSYPSERDENVPFSIGDSEMIRLPHLVKINRLGGEIQYADGGGVGDGGIGEIEKAAIILSKVKSYGTIYIVERNDGEFVNVTKDDLDDELKAYKGKVVGKFVNGEKQYVTGGGVTNSSKVISYEETGKNTGVFILETSDGNKEEYEFGGDYSDEDWIDEGKGYLTFYNKDNTRKSMAKATSMTGNPDNPEWVDLHFDTVVSHKAENGHMLFGKKAEDGYSIGNWDLRMLNETGFTIKQMKEYLDENFRDSFKFEIFEPKPGTKAAEFIPDHRQSSVEDKRLADVKFYFPTDRQSKSGSKLGMGRGLVYRVYQGQENTYFSFVIMDDKYKEYIGTFGFKDQGDVSTEYVTRFVAFLHEAYGFPFTIKHTIAKDGKKIGKKQKEEDASHLSDVEQRLTDGEIEIEGKALTPKQVKAYMFNNMSEIIELGREGMNPFDTVAIIEDRKMEAGEGAKNGKKIDKRRTFDSQKEFEKELSNYFDAEGGFSKTPDDNKPGVTHYNVRLNPTDEEETYMGYWDENVKKGFMPEPTMGSDIVYNVTYFDKGGTQIDQTQIDEKNKVLAWELFKEFGHTKKPGMYLEWEEVIDEAKNGKFISELEVAPFMDEYGIINKTTGKFLDYAQGSKEEMERLKIMKDGQKKSFGRYAAKGKKVKSVDDWYKEAMIIFYAHVGNNGSLDYSEKEYGYLNDATDEIDVGYYKKDADGDYQEELKQQGYSMTAKEVIDVLKLRLGYIEDEVGEVEYNNALTDKKNIQEADDYLIRTAADGKRIGLTDSELWDLIKKANWAKDHDYNRIKKEISKLPKTEQQQLRDFIDSKVDALDNKFRKDWLGKPGINVSDDGWWDLRAEVVGRGEEFYNNITVKELQTMANNSDYHENFQYAVQDIAKDGKKISARKGNTTPYGDTSFKLFKQKLEDALFKKYAVMLNDTGFDNTHIKLAIDDHETIDNLVSHIGQKYELTPVAAAGSAIDDSGEKKEKNEKTYICTIKDRTGKEIGSYPISYKDDEYVNNFLEAIGVKLKASDTKEIAESE